MAPSSCVAPVPRLSLGASCLLRQAQGPPPHPASCCALLIMLWVPSACNETPSHTHISFPMPDTFSETEVTAAACDRRFVQTEKVIGSWAESVDRRPAPITGRKAASARTSAPGHSPRKGRPPRFSSRSGMKNVKITEEGDHVPFDDSISL